MLLAVVFVLGVGNFAIHRAVLESGHPLIESLPRVMRADGGRLSLYFEFFVLLLAMLLTIAPWNAVVWLYLAYSLVNGIAGWLILDRRI